MSQTTQAHQGWQAEGWETRTATGRCPAESLTCVGMASIRAGTDFARERALTFFSLQSLNSSCRRRFPISFRSDSSETLAAQWAFHFRPITARTEMIVRAERRVDSVSQEQEFNRKVAFTLDSE